MADHADDDAGNNNDVFVYIGGDQEVPEDVTHVRIHKSVKIIPFRAFHNCCRNLVSIEMHDGVEIIEEDAFWECTSLIRIKLPGVRVIENYAFYNCKALVDVEFGNKLETIGRLAFARTSLRSIKIPNVRVIGNNAFVACYQLTAAELSEDLERIGCAGFHNCPSLRRITIPLKDDMFDDDGSMFCLFSRC